MMEELWQIREAVRNRKPLVYNITNNVVTNFTANVLMAAGASPIMSEGAAEANDLAKIADVLVLNIGTLHPRQVDYCLEAGDYANAYRKPIVFDPVGAGATAYRNDTAALIVSKVKPGLIRGNYGEIGFLSGIAGKTKGVDSASSEVDVDLLKELAVNIGAVIAATGRTDYITDGITVYRNTTGHEWLQLVTGTGCALSALAGAFMAVAGDSAKGVLAALSFYGAAAEKAAANSTGPGSFAANFLDALYTLNYREFLAIVRKGEER